ncbi:MAG: hypothetical protein KBB91_03155 [Candidatus Pacebacteria bacterium]|nr:hypothetical protein [Candidatus Paceibacterota bacterium]
MNTTLKTVLVLIVLVVLGFVVWKYGINTATPAETPVQALDKETQPDTTGAIDARLNAIDVNTSIDADFEAIDADLKAL